MNRRAVFLEELCHALACTMQNLDVACCHRSCDHAFTPLLSKEAFMPHTLYKLSLCMMISAALLGCETNQADTRSDGVAVALSAETPPEDKGAVMPETSDDVTQSLSFLVQEEKVARDVYASLGQLWPHRTFENIQRSEQRHMDAIANLLAERGLPDPNEGLEPGQFKDASLQTLHNTLLDKGKASLEDALYVGALIEEQDIADLSEHLETHRDPQVVEVLMRLRRASYNHLDGFTSSWEKKTGSTYSPQLLEQEVYDEARAAGAAHHQKHRGQKHGGAKGDESCEGAQH